MLTMKHFNLLINGNCISTSHIETLATISKVRYFKECDNRSQEIFNIKEADKVVTIFKHKLIVHRRIKDEFWILELEKNFWFETFFFKFFGLACV